MKEITVDASVSCLDAVNDYINAELEAAGCGARQISQIDLAVEEIFVNIANYAYSPSVGKATITCDLSGDPPRITIGFCDNGKPFDPLKRADPDITLSAEDREIGGLGIFLTKELMDDVSYEYKDGKNILTISKIIK